MGDGGTVAPQWPFNPWSVTRYYLFLAAFRPDGQAAQVT